MRPIRTSAAVLLAAAACLGAVGCGGDEEEGGVDTAPAAPTTATSPGTPTNAPPPPTTTAPSDDPNAQPPPETSGPEDQPGGAGDEEPARVEAALSGRGGRIGPRVVKVPPYISVEVTLFSADGRGYQATVEGRRLAVGGDKRSDSASLDGLRPGARYTVQPSGGSAIRIEASAEPGP